MNEGTVVNRGADDSVSGVSSKALWLSQLKVGSVVWWNDPDDGISTGAYTVSKVPDDASHDDCMFTIENAHESVAEVPGSELEDVGPRGDRNESIPVEHWASGRYRAGTERDGVNEPVFDMEIEDKRASSGQAWLTLSAQGGHVDDMLAVCVEVSSIEDQGPTQVAHVHFDGDNLAFSVFKCGDSYLIRTENGVQLEPETLPSGQPAWRIK